MSKARPADTVHEISLCVVNSIFPVQRYFCVANVHWGMLPWEADILALSESGYLYETEIKRSIPDLRNDAKKQKWNLGQWGVEGVIKSMWYALPSDLAVTPKVAELIPEFAGILSCEVVAGRIGYMNHKHEIKSKPHTYYRANIVRKPKINGKAKKLDDRDRMKLARLGTMRYWSVLERKVVCT